jgi:F-type H+-transporting ATPase subunit b
MLIDWFTVTAQILNFLALVWLLKHFLYKPILDAIDAREARIAAELADADAARAEALQERSDFQQRNEAFDQQRAAQLERLAEEARVERQRRLEEARQAGDALLAKRRERLDSDVNQLKGTLSRRTQQEVFAIARRALTDLAGTGLEQRMVEVFLNRLGVLEDSARESLTRALKAADEPALLRSAFELSLEQRATVQKTLNEAFSAEVPLRFETAPEVISGIELSCNGQKLAWSIAEYLRSLEAGVDEVLSTRPGAVASAPLAADQSPEHP